MQLSSLRRTQLATVAVIVALGSLLILELPWSAEALGNGTQPVPVAVNCEPTQQAIVRQTMVNGEAQVNILCVSTGQQQPVAYVDQYGRPVQMMPANAMGPSAVAYPAEAGYGQPVYMTQPAYTTQPVYAPPPVARRPVAQRASVSQRQSASERPAAQKRSWTKTAMVIGGSAGAGAGVGGLIGGKKGALIGAALGGGGASIYESTKR
jgi:hypothetical protein